MSELHAGANVDSWCTKCKLMLAHTIEAMLGADPKRVACNTCGSKHVHRPFPPGEGPAKKAKTTAASKRLLSGTLKASDYDKMMKGRDVNMAQTYSLKSQYIKGDLIHHVQFGPGLVTLDKGANKMEVIFPEGPKTLIHGRL